MNTDSSTSLTTSLETLIPEPVLNPVTGEPLSPVVMDNLQAAIRSTLPVLQALKSGALEMDKLKSMDLMCWVETYAEHGAALKEMVAYLADMSQEQVGRLTIEEFVNTASAVVRVNGSFFLSLARLIQDASAMAAASRTTGQQPSSD